eukprot:maker-scaffold80_size398941-snap-gene-1.9 protein:Tk02818 transcript:maker-scaffold80_size398941-snap-gene-1.9-mRNA-1 annotation:"hypothetical protein BRAFLDRAFT_126791"
MHGDQIQLWSRDRLQAYLSGLSIEGLAHFWAQAGSAEPSPATVSTWLKFVSAHAQRVKKVEADIPAGILPAGLKGWLTDVRIGSPRNRRVPDDAMYNQHADLREHIARGNTVWHLQDSAGGQISQDQVIFALKKFTGGMGDEDENQPDNDKVWMKYFLQPVTQTHRIVCTQKANGEAAHFSIRWLQGQFYVCAGSKNVHLLCRSREDIAKYSDGRYLVARTVAESALALIDSLEDDQASILLSFMHYTRVTGVFEILQPHYQHVVDLSHLPSSQLNFICFTLPFGAELSQKENSLCALQPQMALALARTLGLHTIDYEVIEGDQGEARMDLVRRGYGYEGEVFYYLDRRGNVIGLLKKKTAWYVMCRAIREKARQAHGDFEGKRGYDQIETVKKLKNRIGQIQTWLGFGDTYKQAWEDLGVNYLIWLMGKAKAKTLPDEKVQGNFPALWKQFMKETNSCDRIEWS